MEKLYDMITEYGVHITRVTPYRYFANVLLFKRTFDISLCTCLTNNSISIFRHLAKTISIHVASSRRQHGYNLSEEALRSLKACLPASDYQTLTQILECSFCKIENGIWSLLERQSFVLLTTTSMTQYSMDLYLPPSAVSIEEIRSEPHLVTRIRGATNNMWRSALNADPSLITQIPDHIDIVEVCVCVVIENEAAYDVFEHSLGNINVLRECITEYLYHLLNSISISSFIAILNLNPGLVRFMPETHHVKTS